MYLKALKEFYPPLLLLLVFVPILIGLFIDYELFDGRNVIINLVWIPVVMLPFILFKKQLFYRAILVLYFIAGFIEITHWIILKGPLTITSLLVLTNTNLQEAIEFMDLKASSQLFVLMLYALLFVFAMRKKNTVENIGAKPILSGGIVIVAFIFIAENAFHDRLVRKGLPQIAKVSFSFFEKRSLYREALLELEPKNLQAKTTFKATNQTCVVILGESCNRKHMSLYGYDKKTSPKLESRNDLIVFKDVISSYSNTINSVLSMFTYSSEGELTNLEGNIDVNDIFHSAGFKTYWISNQSPIGIWDNLVTVYAKKSDEFQFVNISSNSSFEAAFTRSYDAKLFEPLKKVLDEKVEKKFIVIHLMGSHSAYRLRYPSDYSHFSGKDKKEKTIAEYDNSVLYNDFIVDSLINMISLYADQVNSECPVIYLSDHGENVYDEMDKVGHDFSKEIPGSNVEVPFIVWLSNSYRMAHPDKFDIMESNTKSAFMIDDLCHALLDVNGIESPHFEKNKSVFNELFIETDQRILENGQVYEANKKL